MNLFAWTACWPMASMLSMQASSVLVVGMLAYCQHAYNQHSSPTASVAHLWLAGLAYSQ